MFIRDLRVPDAIIYVILLDFVILEVKHYLKRNSSFMFSFDFKLKASFKICQFVGSILTLSVNLSVGISYVRAKDQIRNQYSNTYFH